MLEQGECSLLRIQTSFPLLLQCGGMLLSIGLFVYRTSNLDKKRYIWSTSTSLLLFHVALYVTFLGMLIVICFEAFAKLCTPVWTCLSLTLVNWLVNGVSLHYSILPKFDLGIHLQVLSSLAEVIFVLYIVMHVLLEAEALHWWYWTVVLGVVLWCFLCNIGFLALLYGGKSRSILGELRGYSLLHGERDSEGGQLRQRQRQVEEGGVPEERISQSVCFLWFTEVLQVGNTGSLTIDDLPSLPPTMSAMFVRDALQQQAEENQQSMQLSSVHGCSRWFCWPWQRQPQQQQKGRLGGSSSHTAPTSTTSTTCLPPLRSTAPLFHSLMAAHRNIFFTQGLLKLISLCLSFSGPLLLGQMVSLIEDEKEEDRRNVTQGVLLTIILAVSFLASTLVNVQYNIRGDILRLKMKNALSLSVFSRVIDFPLHDLYAKDIAEAQASNMLQVDVDRVSSIVNSFHDLWSLPVQIGVAFLLLYLQVDIAFVAGVVIIIVMIPINNYIAKKIGLATEQLMVHKDARVKFISECFRGIKSIKASGWEEHVLRRSMGQRDEEVKYLSRRKYLDALCVFLWASMPLLVPFATFVTTVTVVKESLSVSQVFTTIALLNMLIFPMNAFPWIINGFVEAVVSFRRLSVVLIDARRGDRPGLGGRFAADDDGDSASSVVLGGKAFIDQFESKEKKHNERFYSFITNSSRLYSFIDDMLDDSAMDLMDMDLDLGGIDIMDGACLESALMQPVPDTVLVEVEDLNAGWHSAHGDAAESAPQGLDDSAHSLLGDASFSLGPVSITDVRRAQVVVVCGSVGSGKSTLIYALLQECCVRAAALTSYEEACVASNHAHPKSDARVPLPPFLFGSVSLCPQRPALHTGTIKSNILFETPFDSRRYQHILRGCCLDEDFETSGSKQGEGARASDESSVGQGGNQLSGGQRLRVGIARALYARTDIVLLDDPLSALDTATAHRVMLFLHQICREERRVLIIATNDVHLVCHCKDETTSQQSDYASSLVFLSRDSGNILKGNYSDLHAKSAEFRNMVDSEFHSRRVGSGEWDGKDEAAAGLSHGEEDLKKFAREEAASREAARRQEEATKAGRDELGIETIERGHIRSSVVLRYLRAMGSAVALIILLSTICMQATANGMTIWLAYWTDHEEDISNSEFLLVSCTIVGLNVLFALARSFWFAYGGLQAAKRLYRQLTTSTLRTYVHFFEVQSLGRLLNRFGKDTDCIDEDLPFMLNIVLAQVFTLTGALVIIIFASPMVVVVLVVVAFGYYKLQKFYRRSSRDMRRLESTYASPVGTLLMDCLANAPVIRAQQLQRTFDIQFSKALDKAQQVSLSASIASQWLTLRLQLLGLAVIVAIALLAVINAAYGIVPMSGSRLGLSLSYAFALVGYVNGLVDSASRAEQELISVERVGEYVSLPDEFEHTPAASQQQEALGGGTGPPSSSVVEAVKKLLSRTAGGSDGTPVSTWPQNGEIELSDVSFSYALEHEEYEYLLSIKHAGETKAAPRLDGMPRSCGDGSPVDESSFALSHVSLAFAAGSRTVVVGRTGSGKTSLLRTILNMSTSFDGDITVGGKALQEIPKQLLRASFGVISQETFLFTGTVRDNIDICGHHTDEEVLFVLNNCGILQTFCQMKAEEGGASEVSPPATSDKEAGAGRNSFRASHGYLKGVLDVILVDSSLSQGQKQLLAVARILLSKPQFVLLDEASSALDPLSEAQMYSVLLKHLPSTTTLLAVNHRCERSVIQELCPQVLELSRGKVVRFDNEINLSNEV